MSHLGQVGGSADHCQVIGIWRVTINHCLHTREGATLGGGGNYQADILR